MVSDGIEEHKGLSSELLREGIKHYKCRGLDRIGLSFLKVGRIISAIYNNDYIDVAYVGGLKKFVSFYLATRIVLRKKIPLICHIDSIHDKSVNKISGGIISKVAYRILNLANRVVAVSEWTRTKLIEYGVRPDKITVVYNGIDLDRFDSRSLRICSDFDFNKIYTLINSLKGKVIIANVAMLYSWKGHQYFLFAASELLKMFKDTYFLIVGDGPERRHLEKLSSNLGVSSNVIFAGRLQADVIPSILSKTNICVLSSTVEQCPKVILEYMVAGKPIVATRVGGVPELVINGINGYLVPPKDHKAIAEAIIHLIENPDEARELGMNSRKMIEREFDMKTIVPKIEELLFE